MGVLAKSVEPYLIFGYYYVINSQYGSKCLTTFFRRAFTEKRAFWHWIWCSSSFFTLSRYALVSSEAMRKWRTHGNIRLISNSLQYMNLWRWMNYFWLAMVLTWDLLGSTDNSRFFLQRAIEVCTHTPHTYEHRIDTLFFAHNIWQPQIFFRSKLPAS